MITPEYVRTMARYNRWQNESLYKAAGRLDDAARRLDRGAFFGSIHATLNHLLWGDQIWVHRFSGSPPPQATGIPASATMIDDWETLASERTRFDSVIVDWAAAVRDEDLAGDLTWFSGGLNREVTRPRGLLVTHMFNHQTHHRGQTHAMLTAAGVKPTDTDLPFMHAG